MSTKVYNGVRFATTDMVELHKHFMKWRKRVKELTIQAEAKFLAEHAVTKIDIACATGADPIDSPLAKANRVLSEMQDEVRKTQRRNPLVDFEFNAVVLPYRGNLYGIAYCEQSAWLDEFKSQKWVEDFAYWNSTDRPDEVTRDEWRARQRVWSNITKPDPSPAQNGFTADCTAQFVRARVKDILPMVRPFEKRVEVTAKEIVTAAYTKEIAPPPQEGKKDDYSWLWKAMGYANTDEGKVRVAAEIERITPLLHPVMTQDILLGFTPQEGHDV